MMPGVSEMWEEMGGGGTGRFLSGGGGGGLNTVAPWRFETLSENIMADSAWICQSSAQREMESLTRALQKELCSANYENELSFSASSLRSFKAQRKLSSEAERGNNGGGNNTMNLRKNNVAEMMNSRNVGFKAEEEKGMNLIEVEKGLNLSKSERGRSVSSGGGSEIESLMKGKSSNSLSVNGAGKVSKRKSRAASKTPITFLNADPANFRAMVQQVTGVPLNPSATRLWPPPHGVGVPALLKPEPKRPSSSSSSAASIIQGLPTLDTSALFIHSARQNPVSASAADYRPFSAAPAADATSNKIFLTEKLRAACMQSLTKNNGGGADFAMDQESDVNIVATEADSWLNASNLEGILSDSNFELARSSPM